MWFRHVFAVRVHPDGRVARETARAVPEAVSEVHVRVIGLVFVVAPVVKNVAAGGAEVGVVADVLVCVQDPLHAPGFGL